MVAADLTDAPPADFIQPTDITPIVSKPFNQGVKIKPAPMAYVWSRAMGVEAHPMLFQVAQGLHVV